MANRDFFPWDQIPDTDVLADGRYLARGKKLEDLMSSGEGKDGVKKRMFKAQLEIVEPKEFAGMVHFENYVTGTAEASEDIVPGTMGTKSLKRLLAAAQIPAGNSIGQLCKTFEGSMFMLQVSEYADDDGPYKGVPRNRITKYAKVGEMVPGLEEGQAKAKKGKGAAAASQAAKIAAQVPQAPTPMAPPVQVASPPPGPTMPPLGAQPIRMSPPCSICGAVVPMSEFGTHVAACAAAQA